MKVKLLSRVRLLVTPWTAAYQAPPSMGFSRQEYWSGVPLPSPGDFYTLPQNMGSSREEVIKVGKLSREERILSRGTHTASVARTYWQVQGSNASSAEHKHMKREKEKEGQNLAYRSSHKVLRAPGPKPWFLCFLNEDSNIYQIRFL